MTNNPYTLQNTVLRHIAMLEYRKVPNYPAYGLSFLPTEPSFKPYLHITHETGLKDFPFVIILDDSPTESVIDTLIHSARPRVYKALGTLGNTIPCWIQTAKQWLASHDIRYTEMTPLIRTTDINELSPDYIPPCYSNNKSLYAELHINKESIDNEMVLVNIPYKRTDSTYILYVHKQTTAVIKRDREMNIFKCCEFKLHEHRRALLQSTIDNCKCDDADKWLQINEMLMKEEQWLTDHASWCDNKLYSSFVIKED